MSNLSRFSAALIIAGLGCWFPTDICACPPARTAVYVIGSLTDAAGSPVADARLYLDGVPTNRTWDDPILVSGPSSARSDAAGAFRGVAYSHWSPATLELRAVVVSPDLADTIRLSGGSVPFRQDGTTLDTARVTLRLP